MKKILFAISAIAVLLGFTACTSENETLEPQGGKTITIKASTEETTRTTLNGNDTDGYKVFWSTGDKIKIGTSEFTLSSGAGTTSGTFTGPTLTAEMYSVYYPTSYYSKNWPTAQTYTAGNITGSPMYATFTNIKGVEPSITFRNEGGILRLNLKGYATIKVTKIEVSATDLNPITLDCGTGVQLDEDTATPFHIAVPGTDAGTAYSGLKIVISYKDAANQEQECTKTAKAAITIQRSKITDITLSPEFDPGYLCFTAQEPDATIRLYNHGSSAAEAGNGANLQYSTDLKTWTTLNTTGNYYSSTIKLANVGDKVYFKGENARTNKPNPRGFNQSIENYTYFKIPKKVSASGNVMSLLDPSCKRKSIPSNYCFYSLFSYCALTTAPKLPATTLAGHCYWQMFQGCESLVNAPELPATTLAKGCYQHMFYSCTSLVDAPELPAMTLAENCYCGMFSVCTSLVNAPELPAPEMVESCYSWMFNNCSSLKSITCLATHITVSGVENWVKGVLGNSDGTFTKAAGSGWPEERGDSGIPAGWTVLTK